MAPTRHKRLDDIESRPRRTSKSTPRRIPNGLGPYGLLLLAMQQSVHNGILVQFERLARIVCLHGGKLLLDNRGRTHVLQGGMQAR